MPFGAQLTPRGVRFLALGAGLPAGGTVPGGRDGSAAHGRPRRRLVRTDRARARPGTRYRFELEGGLCVPDPASRFNPDDVHGASEVMDPRAFTLAGWRLAGRPWTEAVIYELHVGAFSPEGSFDGVSAAPGPPAPSWA